MPKRVDNILANLEVASGGLADVSRELKTGDGIATELIYGENGEELAVELRQLATALSALTEDIKNEESLIHTLIYDQEKAAILDDLAATAASLRTTSEMLESGEGTLGLMARDPALYEELRALVGGAQRNKLLRAYIRHTISKSEEDNAGAFSPDVEE
jgi:phospholipid/cholesterol/gamma-HCH transport system substrate-binding protein